MDFLDPKKRKAHAIRIWVGYVLIGTALLLATTILLYLAYGFRITREGQIIQNGLVFMSSQPVNAVIYTNGEQLNRTTNTRLSLPAGQYTFELKRDGYRDWKRGITVEGGSVQRFAYPFLFPTDLRSTSLQQLEQPGAMIQSTNNRWLLVQTAPEAFAMFDLSQREPTPATLTVPADILSASTTTTGWEEVEWADGSRYVLLERSFERNSAQGHEYILFDRENPAESRNLTTLLGFHPTTISLRDGAYDKYFAFDRESGVVFTASLNEPTPAPYLRNVLAFKDDGPDTIVYATNEDAPEGKTRIRLYDGNASHTIREVTRDDQYLLNIARYRGTWIVAAGAQRDGQVYVYQNPLDRLRDGRVLVPVQILKADKPTQISFSSNARFIMIHQAGQFAVYDAETERGYAYRIETSDDAAVGAAHWMDGHHITVVSGEQLVVFDFDGTNQHTLVPTKTGTDPAFNPAYTFMYTISPENSLQRTSLRTPADE